MNVLAVAMAIAAGSQLPVTTAADYGSLVHDYRSGKAEEAVLRVATLDGQGLEKAFRSFMLTTPSANLLTAAAAMHTEAAFWGRTGATTVEVSHHLGLAAGIVELGTPRKMKRLGAAGLKSPSTVSPQFRRLWFLTVITAMEFSGLIVTAGQYLENARLLFPHDADVLLLSGIAEEMRASNRLANASAGARRTALGYAEVYLRESLELAPARMETRLRLGRVLFQRGHLAEAREPLTAVSGAQDVRLAYLASLFLGGLEDAAGNAAGAAEWYARAAQKIPSAQAAQLAASELRHRAGERQQAADAMPSAIGPNNSADPWWAYLFGEYWRLDLYLDALRKMSRS
jgi:hypothetical protein